ncbi:glycosyltransferase family 4 protein [Solitalea koreensis]|uniref:Glycosyltransferase involved in cell wall bisynthesis n=1 Tax=Solitalea koreensis TaxID=543615 RepID=A0A521CGY9_9SPHI|nr:glycosyltransferase family 1 protein [Solitalea koreensis]SMO58672.1 Glycosyltransferase involved in cell wall bisynthesis [Solitalea koreensis]
MNDLKIGFDAKRLFQNYTGLGNYSRMVVGALQQYYPDNKYHLFTPKVISNNETEAFLKCNNSIIHQPEGIFKSLKSVWRTFQIPQLANRVNLDIYHGLSHELPIGLSSKVRSVVTIHDLIFMRYPELFNPIDRAIYLRKWKYACKHADRIVAISKQTKNDLINMLGISENKIDVVYQGCAEQFKIKSTNEYKTEIKLKYKLPDKYLLYVGTIEKRKNLLALLKALTCLPEDIMLVVLGKPTSYFSDEVKPFVAKHKLENRIVFIHKAKYEELPPLYQLATVFLYPSVFEGFGIPILEALKSEVPVITSSGSCFSEAGGPGSIYIHPEDYDGLAAAIKKVWNDKAIQSEMIAKGLEYSLKFDDSKIAQDMMMVYQNLLS